MAVAARGYTGLWKDWLIAWPAGAGVTCPHEVVALREAGFRYNPDNAAGEMAEWLKAAVC
ncbi:MAG TPA: hypothetical protein VGD64_15455 [Acidisarcina sp.]